ncbi:MAG: nucleotidyl transferase AbiEii/AbiGii toxin family protein [Waddliaceae bacterium]
MDRVLRDMINRYECKTVDDYQNALKEIIQDIALLGLWRAKFFEHAAFYGGTALRTLYNLNRFSEDLDFMLLKMNSEFQLKPYQNALQTELAAFGLTVTVTEKKKTKESAIRSAFLKANTKEHVIRVGAPKGVVTAFQLGEAIKIKLEIDTDPCSGFVTETRNLINPVPFWVRTLSRPSLFSGKMHAVICRGWGKRVKGRDWYDMLWFIQRGTPLDLEFLERKMRQTGHLPEPEILTQKRLLEMLHARIEELDVAEAKEDVIRFIQQPQWLDGWSTETFRVATNKIIFKKT